jgi:hypothetical protein
LKNHLLAAAPTFFPKSSHVLNLEEPAWFNEMLERFIALVEAGRWASAIQGRLLDNRRRFARDHPLPLSARSGPPALFVWFILEVAPDVRTSADALRDFQRPRLAKAV